MRLLISALLLLPSCGSDAPDADRVVDVPQPSGPPVAQQVDAIPQPQVSAPGPVWESVASGEGHALRLTGRDEKLLLSIACLNSPPRLAVSAPGFSPIGSEDRFSFGLGQQPVTLVADPTRQTQPGVTGEGPVPGNLSALMNEAEQVSALYGTQQIGPHPAPSGELKQGLLAACSDRR